MTNVLADLAVEAEAAIRLGLRLAVAVDRPDDEHEQALRRIGLPVAKFWVCKRTPFQVAEALECLGGNGYVEESGLPLLFRDSPLNSMGPALESTLHHTLPSREIGTRARPPLP